MNTCGTILPEIELKPFHGCDGKPWSNAFIKTHIKMAIDEENYEWAQQCVDELANRDAMSKTNYESKKIESIVYRLWGCTFKELSKKTRKQKYVYIRFCVMFYLDSNSVMTNEDICLTFNLSHTMVIHANKQVQRALEGCNKPLKKYIETLYNEIETTK